MFCFPECVESIHILLRVERESNGKFPHIDVSKFPGDGDSFAPVHTTAIFVPDWSGKVAVGKADILKKVPDSESGLGSFVSSIYFGFTRAATDRFEFASAAPAYGPTHAKHYVSEQGLNFVYRGSFAILWMTSILGTPICVSIYPIGGWKGRVRVNRERHICRRPYIVLCGTHTCRSPGLLMGQPLGGQSIITSSLGRYDWQKAFLQSSCFSLRPACTAIDVIVRELSPRRTGVNFSRFSHIFSSWFPSAMIRLLTQTGLPVSSFFTV
jgi:hypothetical protein